MWTLATGKRPFKVAHVFQHQVEQSYYNLLLEDTSLSGELKDLLSHMLYPTYNDRLKTVNDV